MSGDHGLELEQDMEGWWRAICDCGWSSPPAPGAEEAADFYGDHRAFEAPPAQPENQGADTNRGGENP